MLAEEWQLGDVLVRLLVLLFWVVAAWIFISVFADLFRRRDISGPSKAGWLVLIFLFPVIGAIVYVMTKPQPGRFDPDAEREESLSRHIPGKTV
jgi:predicted membrane channel-forming protein YqfA (hemolysin III family)